MQAIVFIIMINLVLFIIYISGQDAICNYKVCKGFSIGS
jgi:hypothetical protein